MEELLNQIKKDFRAELKTVNNLDGLNELRIKYLGRKGSLAQAIKGLKDLSVEQRPRLGKLANKLKKEIEQKLNQLRRKIELELQEKKGGEMVDVTASLPSAFSYGHWHPLSCVINEMIEIFSNLGFQVVEGPEIETDWYNFEALNIPPDHPARDMQDSFYINDKYLPRTQTSSVQVRYLEKHKPPVRIVVPGRTYRRESDVTHTVMFHQLEGLLVDERTTMADLKGILTAFAKAFFGAERQVRFRPSYFPFTEPSAEMDISCGICQGRGCRSCKYSGWLEILGAGMVHPNVLKNGGVDPQKYQGFAFGTGIERPAMLKYNIDDIRLFFENDLRFLEQF